MCGYGIGRACAMQPDVAELPPLSHAVHGEKSAAMVVRVDMVYVMQAYTAGPAPGHCVQHVGFHRQTATAVKKVEQLTINSFKCCDDVYILICSYMYNKINDILMQIAFIALHFQDTSKYL